MSQIFLLSPGKALLEACQTTLPKLKYDWQKVSSLEELIANATDYSLVFLPLNKVKLNGLSSLRRKLPTIEMVAIADAATVEEATETMRRGAVDYLSGQIDDNKIRQAVTRWRKRNDARAENRRLSKIINLMELGRTLTSTLRLDELYDQIIDQVQRAFEPDTVSLMLLNGRGQRLRLVAHRGLSATTGTEVTIEESIAGKVMREGRPQLLLGGLQNTAFENLARHGSNIGSAMSIPLTVQGKTLGVLNVNRNRGRPLYSEDDANLLHVFAAQIAIALDNAQLYENLREERDRIIQAQEDVRRELARDLHDGLAQVLATLAVNIEHLKSQVGEGKSDRDSLLNDLEFMRQVARQAIHDARTLTFGLRPLVLETHGIVPALEHYLRTVREGQKRTAYHLEHDGTLADISLPPKVARMLFAILQEAINNARKHAQARNIWVTLSTGGNEEGPGVIEASVRDDGVGFNLNQVEEKYHERYSFGLVNMKERASLIEARLHMESGDEGTVVRLEVPLLESSTT